MLSQPWLWDGEQRRAALARLERDIRLAEHAMGALEQAERALARMEAELGGMEQGLGTALQRPQAIGRALDAWLRQCVRSVDAHSTQARFGPLQLLSGALGVRGWSEEEGFRFVMASPLTRSSPPKGYRVHIVQEPAAASLEGLAPLTPALLRAGITLMLQVDQTHAVCELRGEARLAHVVRCLQDEVYKNDLPLVVGAFGDARLWVRHRQKGAAHGFWACSQPQALFGNPPGEWLWVGNGQDVQGQLHGEPGLGQGSLLIGRNSNAHTAGLVIQRVLGGSGRIALQKPPSLGRGRVHVVQSHLRLSALGDEAGQVVFHLDPARARDLARGVDTRYGYASLALLRAGNARQAADSLAVVRQAAEEVRLHRKSVRRLRFQEGPQALGRLRVRVENLFAQARLEDAPPTAEAAQSVEGLHLRLHGQLLKQRLLRPLNPAVVLTLLGAEDSRELVWN